VKTNDEHKYVLLQPLSISDIGGELSMDQKILTGTTDKGSKAILVIVESFLSFDHLIPVKDVTAKVTATAIVKHIVPF